METMSNRVDRWLLERLLKLMEEEETSSLWKYEDRDVLSLEGNFSFSFVL